jgi:hypothetical protein
MLIWCPEWLAWSNICAIVSFLHSLTLSLWARKAGLHRGGEGSDLECDWDSVPAVGPSFDCRRILIVDESSP